MSLPPRTHVKEKKEETPGNTSKTDAAQCEPKQSGIYSNKLSHHGHDEARSERLSKTVENPLWQDYRHYASVKIKEGVSADLFPARH